MSFPISPTNGQIAVINGVSYTYNSTTSSWSRNQLSLPTLSVTVDTFTSDGSTLTYKLSVTPATKELVSVNIDGILQQKTAYNLSTNNITLTGTPATGAVIEVKTITAAPTSVVTGLVYDTFTGDGVTVAYTLSTTPTSKNFTLVTIGGVVQNKANYSVSGNTLTFSTSPPNTAPIEIVTFGPAISPSRPIAAGSDTHIQYNKSNLLSASSYLTFDDTSNTLTTSNIAATNINTTTITSIGNIITTSKLLTGVTSTTLTNPVAVFSGSGSSYDQVAIFNSTGTGSADLAVYGNNGDDTQSWADIGFTGNSFNDANYSITKPGDGYFFVQGNTNFGGNMVIATGNTGTTKDIVFATGGFTTSNIKARLYNSNGTFSVSNTLTAGNLYTAGTLTVLGMTTFQLTADAVASLTGATGTVTHDMSVGAVFYHTNPAANFTANFTNVPTTDGKAMMATLIISQGASAYFSNAVQINGVAQTLKWASGATPTPNANKVDVVAISMIRVSGTWVVMGQLATYS